MGACFWSQHRRSSRCGISERRARSVRQIGGWKTGASENSLPVTRLQTKADAASRVRLVGFLPVREFLCWQRSSHVLSSRIQPENSVRRAW